MGGIESSHKEAYDPYSNIFESVIEKLLKGSISFQTVDDVTKKIRDHIKLKEIQENCTVFISLKGIGQTSIQIGKGSHKTAVIGDLSGCQATDLEIRITTLEITGLFIDSLKQLFPLCHLKLDENNQKVLTENMEVARNFVQNNSNLNWFNAALHFSDDFPLTIVSGSGLLDFSLMEMRHQQQRASTQKQQKEYPTSDLQEDELRKKEMQELNENPVEIEKKGINFNLQDKIKTLLDKKEHQIKEITNEKKYLNSLLSSLVDKNQENLVPGVQTIEYKNEENKKGEGNGKSPKDEHKQEIKQFFLKKINAREISQIRVQMCGNEGIEKSKFQKQLEKLFIALTTLYKNHEHEHIWEKCEIKMYCEDMAITISTGKKKTHILVHFHNDEPVAKIMCK